MKSAIPVTLQRLFRLILALIAPGMAWAAEVIVEPHFETVEVLPKAVRVQPDAPTPPVETIHLFFKSSGREGVARLRLKDGGFNPLDARNYSFLATEKGKQPREIPIVAVWRGGTGDATRADSLFLLPKEAPSKEGTVLEVGIAHAFNFDLPDGRTVTVLPATYKMDVQEAIIDKAFTAPLSSENKLEVLNGTGGGQLSVNYHYRRDRFTAGDWLHADFKTKADISLDSSKHHYFDSIVAELDLFHAYNFGDPAGREQGHAEWGLTGRFESDRDFDNMNATAGVAYEVYFKNRVTSTLHHWLAPQEAGVAPLFAFGYDYVGHISESDSTVDTGSQRLRAGFYWSLPLLREARLPLFGPADGDFLVSLEGLYDVETGRFTDNSRLSLELRQHTDKESGWAYNLTYARGKATPTYENFDAVLFGIKRWF